jgi:L-fuconolactonase
VTRVIDAHHHVWDEPGLDRYPWMAGEALAPLRRSFAFAQLQPLMAAAGIDAAVTVQARTDLEETHELLALAAAEPAIAGVVGWVDLTATDVADALAALASGPAGAALVGVRHQVHDEPDPDWLARRDVLRGLEAVAAAGLAYDLLVRERELPAALLAVQRLPQLSFVVDHLAKPRVREGVTEPWAARLALLARHQNVSCKVSGLVTEADWDGWSAAQLTPYVRQAVEAFGPERLLFGSDWPVCLLAASYAEVVGAAAEALEGAGLDAGEREAVFGANALRTYGLPGDDQRS